MSRFSKLLLALLPACSTASQIYYQHDPTADLHKTWSAVYRDWLPATGYALRDTPPFEVYVDDPRDVPPERLRTDLYLPVS